VARLHDQERLGETAPVHHRGEEREDRPICFATARSVDLTLQHQDLMAERESLSVTSVTTGEHPPEPHE
jgi:hypothetical protein